MRTFRSPAAVRAVMGRLRSRGKTIAFVPTMGALHAGHLSLVTRARREADIIAVSIFVNPTQFGRGEDFQRYPRDLRGDSAKLRDAGVDILFAPSARALYPKGFATTVHVAGVTETLCGPSRPGHFDGVATIVLKLFEIVAPDVAIFGRKDFQQTVVIRRMVRDLGLPVRIVTAPTIRETDGLALSSRNARLSPSERRAATVLYRGLAAARKAFGTGERSAAVLTRIVRRTLKTERLLRVEYVSLVDPDHLRSIRRAARGSVIALAARIGKIRLIDNISL